jgi:hypothetical protein
VTRVTGHHPAVNVPECVVRLRSVDEPVHAGVFTKQAAHFLDASMLEGLNVLVADGTQAGGEAAVRRAHNARRDRDNRLVGNRPKIKKRVWFLSGLFASALIVAVGKLGWVSSVNRWAMNWHAGQWSALAGWVTVGVYLALGYFAWRQLRQVRELRDEEARPYVIVDVAARSVVLYVSIRNIGKTPAYNVRITFDHPLESTRKTRADFMSVPVFAAPIPMLAPNREIQVLFDSATELLNAPNIRLTYEVSVSYEGLHGRLYVDPPAPLDFSHLRSVAVDPPGISDIAYAVRDIGKEIRKWTDGSSGLLTMNVDRASYMSRRDRRWVRRSARRMRKQGWRAYLRWHLDRIRTIYGWDALSDDD